MYVLDIFQNNIHCLFCHIISVSVVDTHVSHVSHGCLKCLGSSRHLFLSLLPCVYFDGNTLCHVFWSRTRCLFYESTSITPISPHTTQHPHQQPPHKLTTNSSTLHSAPHSPHFASSIRSQLHDSVYQVLFYAPFDRGLALLMDCGRCGGTVDELAEVLRRCVNHGGRSFARYSEEASVHASTLDTTAVGEYHSVLLQFHMTSVVQQELHGCCVADRWKGEAESAELDKRSARILDGHIGQALAEHNFACARTVAVSVMGTIVVMETCRLQNVTTLSVTRRAAAVSPNVTRVALWDWNHPGIAISLSTRCCRGDLLETVRTGPSAFHLILLPSHRSR